MTLAAANREVASANRGCLADQEPEPAGRPPRSNSRFRACCTVQAPSGCAVTPASRTSTRPARRWRRLDQFVLGYWPVDPATIGWTSNPQQIGEYWSGGASLVDVV